MCKEPHQLASTGRRGLYLGHGRKKAARNRCAGDGILMETILEDVYTGGTCMGCVLWAARYR
jgi:hypothetical protein